MTTIK